METFARTHFGNDIYNLGSTIKNELPDILGGIAGYQNAINSFTTQSQTAEAAANNIVNGVGAIISATEQLSESINNVIQSYSGQGVPLLNTLSTIGGSPVVANLNNVLSVGASGSAVFTSGNQLINAVQNGNLQGITNAMAHGATSVNNLLSQLNNLVPGFPNAQIPSQITNAIQQLQNGQAVYNAAGSMVTALVADASGKITVGSLTNLTTHFDQNWNTFSSKIDALFNVTPSSGQQAVLETLAKSLFGENVFYAGGAIKHQLPDVLNGVSGVQEALKQFGGSYRDPIAAATKIKTGVEKMVQAIEKISQSLNNMVKSYQGKGDITKGTGYPLLDTLEKLGDTKGIKALDTALRVGGGAAAVYGNADAVTKALKNRDYKGAVKAIKKTIDDIKKLTKKGNYKIPDKQETKAISKQSNKSPDNQATNATSKQNNKTSNPSNSNSRQSNQLPSANTNSYVCSGAIMRCTLGTSPAKLTVLPVRTVNLTGPPMANISDHQSMVNLAPFGLCRSLGYPATASATAANHGSLTPMPCIHNTPIPWTGGKMDYLIKGQPALLKTCKCQCMWGGTISLVTDGQVGEGTQYVQKKPKSDFKQTLSQFIYYDLKDENNHASFAGIVNARNVTNGSSTGQSGQNSSANNTNSKLPSNSNKKKKPSTPKEIAEYNRVSEIVLKKCESLTSEERKHLQEMVKKMPDSLNNLEKIAIAENNIQIEKTLDVRNTGYMSDDDADNRKSNKNYELNDQFGVNCATTTTTFMVRQRGFDVTAQALNANIHTDSISKHLNLYNVWRNPDGSAVSPTLILDEFKAKVKAHHLDSKLSSLENARTELLQIKKKLKNTSNLSDIEIRTLMTRRTELIPIYLEVREQFVPVYKEVLMDACKEEGYYSFGLLWEPVFSKGGHYTVIKSEKDSDGNIILTNIEPQTGSPYSDIDTMVRSLDFPPDSEDSIMRTDNKIFNVEYADLFDINNNNP